MKNLLRYILLPILILGVFASCEDDTEYDVNWPVPEITSVSSYNDALSATITLNGNFTQVNKVYFGNVEAAFALASDEQSLTVEVPRNMSVEGAIIRVTNLYRQSYETTEIFVPIIPETTVEKVGDIPVGLTFAIEGTNVDLLTQIVVDGVEATIVSATVDKILVSSAGLSVKPGQLATVSFKSLAKNIIDDIEKVNVIHPFIEYQELVVWDFEDGTHQYEGEGTFSIKSGASNVPGNVDKYFELRGPGYGWDKATGEMIATEVPDLSTFVNPYITFYVRTPAGSSGYCQLDDQNGHWRHFGYGFDTGGEWMKISEPLGDKWEGGDFDPLAFKPRLGFKSGNAGANQDIDIAYFKITEGYYDGVLEPGDPIGSSEVPALIEVMTFEDTQNYPVLLNGDLPIASLDNEFRADGDDINAFIGSHFYTFKNDGNQNGWSAYWGAPLVKEMSAMNISVFEDPYFSFAYNIGKGKGKQRITMIFWQYDYQLKMAVEFYPEEVGEAEWVTEQFPLFSGDWKNWSDGSTELGAHYASLKYMNPDVPIDAVEVIIGRAGDENDISISFDEFVVTEGARY